MTAADVYLSALNRWKEPELRARPVKKIKSGKRLSGGCLLYQFPAVAKKRVS